MRKSAKLGKSGEEIASRYLTDKGFRVIERNVRRPWGELDIVAKSPDGLLTFVEVKTMRDYPEGIQPEEQMTISKLRKFSRAAGLYAGDHPKLVSDHGFRLDLIAIRETDGEYHIRHYRNVGA